MRRADVRAESLGRPLRITGDSALNLLCGAPHKRFAVTKVDPEGKAHEAVLVLNLPAIDRVSTGPGAARAHGFIPLAELGKKERYAEVLGHELAHAAWTFAEADRVRFAKPFSGEAEGLHEETRQDAREVDRVSQQVEAPAEAAEEVIWAELLAGQRSR